MKSIYFAVIVSVLMFSSCKVQEGNNQNFVKQITYDTEGPTNIRVPKLIEPSKGYISSDQSTFPVYADAQTVAQPLSWYGKAKLAIWCTKEATYVATINYHVPGRASYQYFSDTYIRDCRTNKKFFVKGQLGLPLDQKYFIDGITGETICTVAVFPPLPKACTVIDLISPHEYQFDTCVGMSVAELQANQKLTEYVKTKIIE